jgi:hypothetical protein
MDSGQARMTKEERNHDPEASGGMTALVCLFERYTVSMNNKSFLIEILTIDKLWGFHEGSNRL